jgi:hypothetical protein
LRHPTAASGGLAKIVPVAGNDWQARAADRSARYLQSTQAPPRGGKIRTQAYAPAPGHKHRDPGRSPVKTSHTSPGREPGDFSHTSPGREPGDCGHTSPGREPGDCGHTSPGREPGDCGHTSPGREPGDCGNEGHPACHAARPQTRPGAEIFRRLKRHLAMVVGGSLLSVAWLVGKTSLKTTLTGERPES